MSSQEYKALAMGKTIISSVDYAKRGFKSTAKGICFGIGDYEQAKKDFRRLNGIVETYEAYQVTNSLGNLETVRRI